MPTEIAHTQNGSDASTQTTTDGGHDRAVHPTDLTLFQLLELATVVEQSRYGLAVKRELEAYYGEKIHHGRLYPNLDRLVDLGLVEKYEIDKRTNGYEATERGERLYAAFVRYLAEKGGLALVRQSTDDPDPEHGRDA